MNNAKLALAAAIAISPACVTQKQFNAQAAELARLRADTPTGAPGGRTSTTEDRVADLEAHVLALTERIDALNAELRRLAQSVARLQPGETAVGPGRFHRGQRAPRGLTATEIRQHATAQGDPHQGQFTLAQAFAADPVLDARARGTLVAIFTTSRGSFECELLEDQAPRTVANFVGLARGVRASRDPVSKTWAHRRRYDGTTFHRVISGFMIQGGDPSGTGSGDAGYVIEDEPVEGLKHVTGALSMANRGPNTAGSQFFIMVADAPHLDGRHTIFGQCQSPIPIAISTVAVDAHRGNRPKTPVTLQSVRITRRQR